MGKDRYRKLSKNIYRILIVICTLILILSIIVLYFYGEATPKPEYSPIPVSADIPPEIENGIHVRTGLVDAEGLMTVIANCTPCHSAQIIIQNRMDKEQWASTIRWMQETQNLWDLGENQDIIINYLTTNYPPVKKGRRQPLMDIEWYDLKD